MKNLDKQISVIKAYDNGELIEYRTTHIFGANWKSCDKPEWNFKDYEYRVRPEFSYRPYTKEEFRDAMEENGNKIQDILIPTWYFGVTDVLEKEIHTDNPTDRKISFESLCIDKYHWINGERCAFKYPYEQSDHFNPYDL